MALHPKLRNLIDAKLAARQAPQWELPIAEVRRGFRALWTPAMTGVALPVNRVADVTIPGLSAPLPARLYAPERDRAYPILIYLHGGGYVKGGLDESEVLCRNLAALAQHMVVSVAYRLAPEHPFPAALDDAIAATAWACARAADLGATPGPVVICGESAGGNLAALTALHARSDPRIAIRRQVLLQPVVDFALRFLPLRWRPPSVLSPRRTSRGTTEPTPAPITT